MNFIESLRIIGQRPGMYLGKPSLDDLLILITGFQIPKSCSDDTSALDSFEFWVYHRYHETGSRHWAQIISEQAGGDDAAAFRKFFDDLEKYLAERERIGAEAIKMRFLVAQK